MLEELENDINDLINKLKSEYYLVEVYSVLEKIKSTKNINPRELIKLLKKLLDKIKDFEEKPRT